MSLRGLQLVGDHLAGGEIDEAVGRVGRCLHQDHRDAAFGSRFLRDLAHLSDIEPIGEAERRDAESPHLVLQQGLGAAIERARMDDRVARAQESEAGRRDRGHARGEDGAFLGLVPDRQAILEDFHVGMVEARIDQAGFLAGLELAASGREIEEILALLGVLEDEGRCEEDRRLERAFRHGRRIAEAHHQRLGVQLAVGDPVLVIAVVAHGCPPAVRRIFVLRSG